MLWSRCFVFAKWQVSLLQAVRVLMPRQENEISSHTDLVVNAPSDVVDLGVVDLGVVDLGVVDLGAVVDHNAQIGGSRKAGLQDHISPLTVEVVQVGVPWIWTRFLD